MNTKFILATMALTAATTLTTTAQAQPFTPQQRAWVIDMCQEGAEVAGTAMYHWQQKGEVATIKRAYLMRVSGDPVRTEMAFVVFNDVVKTPRVRSDAERTGVTRQYMRNILQGCLAELG